MADPNSLEQSSSSATIRRPAGSILAPSRLSFGIGVGASDKTNAFGSKISFSGLKASKLSSVAQAVCTSHKADEDTEKQPASVTATQKPSFIPLAKQDTPAVKPTNDIKSPVTAAMTNSSTTTNVLFGTCLDDRAANYVPTTIKNGAESRDPAADEDKLENKQTEKSEKEKTLSESAAEYCENRNRKVEFGEVELITGEEEETNAFQMSAKVFSIIIAFLKTEVSNLG